MFLGGFFVCLFVFVVGFFVIVLFFQGGNKKQNPSGSLKGNNLRLTVYSEVFISLARSKCLI